MNAANWLSRLWGDASGRYSEALSHHDEHPPPDALPFCGFWRFSARDYYCPAVSLLAPWRLS